MPELVRHELHHGDGRRLYVYGALRGVLPAEAPAGATGPGLHQRYDALTDSWIAISPARNARPNSALDATRTVQPGCPLCPGGPELPFSYEAAVFENRWPSLRRDPPPVAHDPRVAPSMGRCEVVLYTDAHEGSLGTLAPEEVARVLAIWRDRSAELWADPAHAFVLVFENRGEAVGATISHPHGQVYAFDRLPPQVRAREEALSRHRDATGSCLTCEVVATDAAATDRAVTAARAFTVAVPFAPRWPYEIHVRARRHGARRLTDLSPQELAELGGILKEVVQRYDALFGFELPYMMTVQEGPDGVPDWHLSVEFLPPHRSAQLTKIRASVETSTGLFINDTLPEASAAALAAPAVTRRTEPAVPTIVHRTQGEHPAGRSA
jgi:UDPglucose--hexose-1-phosphate uridylyltransferase